MPSQDAEKEARLLAWHLDQGWQYDPQVVEFLGDKQAAIALVERIKAWSVSQCLAVIYKAKAFWRNT